MTKEIMEGNAKIAKFMGLKRELRKYTNNPNDPGMFLWIIPIDENNYHVKSDDELKFHSSWDWLMPVVEKIESLFKESLIFIIKANKCYIEMDTQLTMAYNDLPDVPECYSGHCESKIKSAFSTVLQFIDWYNANVTVTSKD